MIRAFRSELIKLTRWSVLVGGAAIIVITALFAYFFVSRVTHLMLSGKNPNLIADALPTPQGLVTVLAEAQPIVAAIAIIIVATSVAGEWSQGTLRNLLVREPARLRWLSGKLLALLLFVVVCASLALLVGALVAFLGAAAQGISTTSWTSSAGVQTFLGFFANSLLGTIGICLLGMAVALLTRSVAIAVGISLAYVLVGEALIAAVWPEGAEWFPVHIFGYLPGVTSLTSYGTAPMGYGADVLVALGYMVGFVAISFAVFRQMDITA